MEQRFINQYESAQLEQICNNLENAYEKFPYSLVCPLDRYEQCLEVGDYFRAFKCVLDFFEISIQYTSGLVISLLAHKRIEFDQEMRNLLEKMIDKPLSFGDWVNDIFIVLVEKGKVHLPDHPLLESLYSGLFSDRNGNILRGWNKKGEEFKHIVSYRNAYLGHDTFLDNEIYKEVLFFLEGRLWEMIAMLTPLENLHFFVLDQSINLDGDTKAYTVLPDKGFNGNKSLRISSNYTLNEHTYYLTDTEIKHRGFLNQENIIQISPFVIYQYNDEVKLDQKFSYIFQTVAAKNLTRMIFISADQKARRKETELFKDSFWRLLEFIFGKFIHHDKYKISFRKEKSFTEFIERSLTQTNLFISQQINSDKYDASIFLNRSSLSHTYETFLEGGCTALIMLGHAGSGKTNQICYWAQQVKEGDVSLAFYGKTFSQVTIEEQLQQVFNDAGKGGKDILTTLDAATEQNGARCIIFFDAINECITYKNGETGNGAIDLLKEINRLFVDPVFKSFKIIISCRSYTWEELISRENIFIDPALYYTTSDSVDGYTVLQGFNEAEFNLVYPKYAGKYKLRTALETLMTDQYAFVKLRLYDPLILKTAAQNFRGAILPCDLGQFNSTSLFEQRLDLLEHTPTGRFEVHILEYFTSILWERNIDALSLKELHYSFENAQSPLYAFAQKIFTDDTFRYTQAFIKLLDEGILRIDKHGRKEVRFVYERFHEYLLARNFMHIQAAALPENALIPAKAYEEVLQRSGRSAVMIGALRNALIMDYHSKGNDPGTIIQLALSPVFESQPLVESTLSMLLNEDYQDVFSILERMLEFDMDESKEVVKKREEVELALKKDKKKGKLSADARIALEEQKNKYDQRIYRILKVRKIAISITYKIFKSNQYSSYADEKLADPKILLWMAMADSVPEVRDNVSIYIYYIARFDAEIGMRILSSLSDKVLKTPVISLLSESTRRSLQQSYIEPACRVGLFMVIDGLVERRDYALAGEILNTWKAIVRKFTLNHSLIKLVMPFFKFLLARQAVVQTDYVNNGIEYRHFWDTVPEKSTSTSWSLEGYRKLIPFLDPGQEHFEQHSEVVINGFLTGDSFSFFLLERVMIVQGYTSWKNIERIVRYLSKLPEGTPFKAYIEMSLLYVLFHINHKSPAPVPEAEAVFAALTKAWTLNNKGIFFSHYNEKANGGSPYKQYTLNWYASAYCSRYGDGRAKPGDEDNVPVFRELIAWAFKKKDKELLYNCIENMAVLVADFGFYKTSLQLFEYLMSLFKYESDIQEFDNITLSRAGYNENFRSFICNMLGTVKSYYPREVEYFIINKLKASQFPQIEKFREEVFNHSLSHEGIGDLLTHKFGNFIIWGILNDHYIRDFFSEAFVLGYKSDSYLAWFDNVVRHSFQRVFDVKNLL